jgi:hypothetical protein
MALALLPAQGEQKIKLFVGNGAGVRWEVNAAHKFRDTALGVMIDAWSG